MALTLKSLMSKVLPSSLRKVLQTHTVPGQFHSLFQPDAFCLQVVKTKEKKKIKSIKSLDYLIPQITSCLLQMRQEKTINKLFKGIKFTKIEADSKLLVIYYSSSNEHDKDHFHFRNNEHDNDHSHDKKGNIKSKEKSSKLKVVMEDKDVRGDLAKLLYRYLQKNLNVQKFPSKLELKKDYISPLLLNVEKDLKRLL